MENNNKKILSMITGIARNLDNAFDNKNIQEIKELIKELEVIEKNNVDDEILLNIYYNLANAYSDIINLSQKGYLENEELVKESLLYYRKGEMIIEKLKVYHNSCAIQLLTNLGNMYSHMNRFSEAINVFEKVINMAPNFSMANGNLGICIHKFSYLSNNSYNQYRFHLESMKYFENAFKYPQYIDSDYALETFKYYYEPLKEHYDNVDIKFPKIKLKKYKTKSEEKYREWCLKNKLVLNELNDIDDTFIASEDILHIKSIITENITEQYSKFHSCFNELKQDFVSNRFMLYEACNNCGNNHFSDNETYLLETFDYSIYTLDTTKLKTVFKNIYSLFDKIAFFINEYFSLNIKYKEVSFKNIWKNELLKKEIKNNLGLYTLYWMYLDLFGDFKSSTEPKIQKINIIRNSIEHRSFKIVDSYVDILNQNEDDCFEFKISFLELKDITIYLFKILRTSLINLILSVKINEEIKASSIDSYIIPFDIPSKDKRDNVIMYE